jgi:hypothetical protein
MNITNTALERTKSARPTSLPVVTSGNENSGAGVPSSVIVDSVLAMNYPSDSSIAKDVAQALVAAWRFLR